MFNIKLKPKYKWKRIKKPRNSQFTISSISLSVCQFVSSLFLFTSKRPLTSMEWLCSLRVTAKYRPLFCRANFQTIWLRKEKKSGTFCCQINQTSELYYGPKKEKKKNICQRKATYEDRTTYLHQRLLQHRINLQLHRKINLQLHRKINLQLHRKIGFSNSGLFVN